MAGDLLRGTALAAAAGACSYFAARFGLGRVYYLAALLPAAMLGMLLVAWLIYLKADGFFGNAIKNARQQGPRDHDRIHVAFDEDVLTRPGAASSSSTWDSRTVMRSLLWAALELGLVSIALYHLAGIGAHLLR